MKLHLLSFGKLKAPGLREAADHYLKAMQMWSEVTETELKPEFVPDKSPETRIKIQAKERDLLLAKKSAGPKALVLLDERGKALRSEEWAEMLRDLEERFGGVTFVIGSSLGFDPELRTEATKIVSLGPQTLPHELARVVMYEQVFRALSILNRHPYHHAD